MSKTFRRKKSEKRGAKKHRTYKHRVRKHYAFLNDAGAIDAQGNRIDTINRVTTIRDYLNSLPGAEDRTPFVLKPYAATRIARSYTKYRSSYAKSLLPWLRALGFYKGIIETPISSPAAMRKIKNFLLEHMPDGMKLERFLNTPNISSRITLLHEKLIGPEAHRQKPEYGTDEHMELFTLVNFLFTTLKRELQKHITIIPPPVHPPGWR